MIRKNNNDMAKSSKTVLDQRKECDQIKMTVEFY